MLLFIILYIILYNQFSIDFPMYTLARRVDILYLIRAQTWLSRFFSRVIIANAIPKKIWRKTKVIATVMGNCKISD